MLLTLDKAFLGLVFNNNNLCEHLVLVFEMFPGLDAAAESFCKTSLFVGGGFSSNLCFASFHLDIASLFSIINRFHVLDT